MPDLGPAFAFLAALVFLAASASLLLVTLRAAQFRAEADQFPSPANDLTPEPHHAARTFGG